MNQNTNVEYEFDLAALKVNTNYAQSLPIHKGLALIPVRKPDKQWFIRVHEDPNWQMDAHILEIKEDNEHYIVTPDLMQSISHEVVTKRLHAAINRQNTLFIWPIKLPIDGRIDDWNRSALNIAELAKREWVRIGSNRTMGMYEPMIAMCRENIPEPEWTEDGFEKIVQAAFKDRIITSMDHPVLKRLRGEV